MVADIQRMIYSLNRVASFPAIVHRVNRALDDPLVSLERLAGLINEDPALSARLLKLANSAFYRFPAPITTITHALTMIGTRQVRDLVTASSVLSMFQGIPPDLVDMVSFWRHSVACGVAARVLATARREANVERIYLIGLLHDIGRLVLFVHMPGEMRAMIETCRGEPPRLLHEEESQRLGCDHAQIGALLLQGWNLPADIFLPVRNHHHPNDQEDFALETAIVHIADIIAVGMNCGSSGERQIPPVAPRAWELMDLPSGAIPKIMEQVQMQFQQASHIFAV